MANVAACVMSELVCKGYVILFLKKTALVVSQPSHTARQVIRLSEISFHKVEQHNQEKWNLQLL